MRYRIYRVGDKVRVVNSTLDPTTTTEMIANARMLGHVLSRHRYSIEEPHYIIKFDKLTTDNKIRDNYIFSATDLEPVEAEEA